MKIALVSTGLGRVLRGFESFTESLFQNLRQYAPHIDVTLFQGGGSGSDGRIVVSNLHRHDIPSRWFGYDKGNFLEKRSFALMLYPKLRRGGYDIVHYNELVMGSALFHMRRLFGGKFKLLYCNGAPSPPIHYHHRCDFAQMLTGPMYEEARSFGLPDDRLFLVPYGVDAQRFSPETRSRRAETRRELGIPEDAKVILTVAAIKREHKRIDYLIEEVSRLDRTVWLLVAGQRTDDTPLLEGVAERLLPGRWRFVSWPIERVPFLYGAADVFVLASVTEAFGLVTVEALLSDLPVIIHNGPVYSWIANGPSAHLIDMSAKGALEQRLREVLSARNCPSSRDASIRFSWEALLPQYLNMYERVAATPLKVE